MYELLYAYWVTSSSDDKIALPTNAHSMAMREARDISL
jgi:hypothetical protein